MSVFYTDLEVRLVDPGASQGRGIWELLSPLKTDKGDVLAGFRTDFMSLDRFPIVFQILGDRFHRSCAWHDAAYSGMFAGMTREQADAGLRDFILSEGGALEQADAIYIGVRMGGAPHWHDQANSDPVAPIVTGSESDPFPPPLGG